MAKARFKPEELLAGGQPQVALLPDSAPASPFLDPSVAQAEPQGSELYNLGTVQQSAASTRDADMFNPSYLQAPQNYPTGAEGGIPQPQGASPLLYPTAAETQPKLKARLKPDEALALAEVNRPRRKSPDEVMDELAVGMNDPSKTPLPQDLWSQATQRRSQMIKDGRLPMEFGEIDSLADGLVWTKDAAYGVGSYILGTLGSAAASAAADPAGTARQLPATIGSAIQRTATEFGLQTYQDIFNLTHEPKYRVKETGEFVAVNKTGLPLVMPPASGGNNVISGDGIINPVTPELGIRAFAEQGKTLVPVSEQDLKDYRYGQYLDRMGMGAQSLESQNFQAPANLAQVALAASPVTAPLAAMLAATDPGGAVGPNQAQAELAVLAAQSVIPAGAASRSWGISRRVAGGLSRAAGATEAAAGILPDAETALRAKFVKTVTSGTNLDAGAQKTALQAAIDGGKTLGIAGGAYAAATGLSAIEGVPSELKQAAWTAANLYSGYKGGMFVARQLRSASGFAKTVLKEVADPAQGLDVGARMRVAANPDVPDFVRDALLRPSAYRAIESTPARLAKNQALSPVSRAVFGKLSDYRFVQAARLAKDTAAGVPKGMIANAPFVAGAMASDDPERAGQMLAAGGVFGAFGGAAGRFTEARQRSVERAESDIARMLVDIQAGNELGSGLGGDILRNRVRPGTQFQDGPGGFVLNPDREVSAFLTEVEMAGGDVSAFVRGKSFDELAQWAAYQGFFRDKVDLVPLNATDYKLNAEAAGQNGSGAYFLQPSEGRRARIFVNAESRRNGLAPHEYGHAVLRGGALSPDQIDAVHAEINSRYAPDALRNMAGEYAATMLRAENAKQGIDIEPSPAAITAKINELSQGSMIKGSADGLDWLREEIFAEEFRNANIDLLRARRNIPLGANPVSFLENLLGAQSRALHMAGIDIDPQTGKPMGRDQIFKENRVAAGDPVVMKNYEAYVKQWKRWINDPTHEVDPGVPVSKTGDVRETADSPNVTWKDYGRGRMETEFAVKNPDGTVTPKDWNKEIKPTVRARQQAVREMSNRSKEVSAADDQTFGMRRRRDGRLETSGRRLPDSFFFIPQYKPFHTILRRINAADDAGETLQVRFFAKGKSKDVFKDGIRNTNAVNREALHGNFVAKKDGTLMWGYMDMTQFRNRVMKAIADKNPALAPYDWNLKAIMDDLPAHLTDQRRGKGGAFSVGQERANILNGLIGIGDGPLVGAFGKGTAYKTIHLDSIDAVVPTGKTGGEFDVYRANRNAMPDDPKPPVDMETDIDNNRMPQQIPREAQGMPDAAASGRGDGMPDAPRRYVSMEKFIEEAGDELTEVLPNAYKNLELNDDNYPTHLVSFSDARNSMYRSRVPSKEFFDWLHSDRVMDGLVFADKYEPATAGEGATHTRESYQALINRLRNISLRKPKPSAAPRGQAMPDAQPAEIRQDGTVVAPEDAPTFTLPRRAMAQFMPDTGINLEDYADRPIVALPADRMGIGQMRVGPKGAEQILSVPGQGGAGFMEIYNGGGWAFTDTATADRFLGRLREVARPGDTSVVVGITALNEVNHLKNQTGQLAYVEALEAAIKNRSISRKQADAHIREIAKRIYTSEAQPKDLAQSTRDKFKAMRSFDDFQKAVRAKSLNFADAAWLLDKMQQRTLPVPYKEARDIGIAFDDVARQTADPRYADVPFGTVVALLEVPINQAPSKNPFHYAYPAKVEGNRIGFLSKFQNIDDLTSDPRIRNKQGRVTAQPLQTVLPVMDRVGQPVRAQFMPDAVQLDADYMAAVNKPNSELDTFELDSMIEAAATREAADGALWTLKDYDQPAIEKVEKKAKSLPNALAPQAALIDVWGGGIPRYRRGWVVSHDNGKVAFFSDRKGRVQSMNITDDRIKPDWLVVPRSYGETLDPTIFQTGRPTIMFARHFTRPGVVRKILGTGKLKKAGSTFYNNNEALGMFAIGYDDPMWVSAQDYGGDSIAGYVRMENPLVLHGVDITEMPASKVEDIMQRMMKNGHDGIVYQSSPFDASESRLPITERDAAKTKTVADKIDALLKNSPQQFRTQIQEAVSSGRSDWALSGFDAIVRGDNIPMPKKNERETVASAATAVRTWVLKKTEAGQRIFEDYTSADNAKKKKPHPDEAVMHAPWVIVPWDRVNTNWKLADPITRDGSGNIIPVSKRFDWSKPDVRFGITAGALAAGAALSQEEQ